MKKTIEGQVSRFQGEYILVTQDKEIIKLENILKELQNSSSKTLKIEYKE